MHPQAAAPRTFRLRTLRLRPALLLPAVLWVAACDSKTTEPDQPTITVSIAPTSASVEQGGSTDVEVTVTGAGGFTGSATISAQNVPSGVTATVSDVQSTGGVTTATVTLAVGGAVAPGTYDVTVRATGTGVTAVTTTFQLTVTALPSYALGASPAQLAVERGTSGTTDIGVTRTDFTDGVTLSAEGLPTGVTASFDPNPATGETSVLTITAGEEAALGSTTFTVRGTADGLDDRTVDVEVLVVEAGAADYLLGVEPTELSVARGESGEATVQVTRVNFEGEITLAAEGAPSGVTVSFGTNPLAGTSSSVTVEVDGTAEPDTYTITISGTAEGLDDRTTQLELTVTAEPGYDLALEPATVSVAQGASGTVDVAISRTGFTGEVTLAVEGAPDGVTASFSVNPVTGDASVLTLDVGAATETGSHTLTVRGTSTLADRTDELTLTVTEGAGFGFAAVDGLTIAQGSSGVRTMTIVRSGGFTGDVTVTVTDLPTGIMASVDPATTSGTTVDVTISVQGSVSPGAYTATVRGNATGLPEATAELAIAVTASGGSLVSLDFSVCEADERPIWLAYQDGDGAWTPVTGSADVYSFTVAADRVGVAAVTSAGVDQSDVLLQLGTAAEISGLGAVDLCATDAAGKSVGATVAGLDPLEGELAYLSLGDATAFAFMNGPVQFDGVADGTVHLVGYKAHPAGTTDRMIIMRGLTPTDGGDIGTVDFASGFVPGTATITVVGGSDGDFWQARYATSPSAQVCYQAVLTTGDLGVGDELVLPGAPDAQREAGEYHVVLIGSEDRTVTESFAALADRTVTYGAALPTPTVTDLSTTYRRLQFAFTLPGEYDQAVTVSVADQSADRAFGAWASTGWLGGSGVSIELPNFSGLDGWQDVWAPAASETSDWSVTALGGSLQMCSEGARSVTAFVTGTVG